MRFVRLSLILCVSLGALRAAGSAVTQTDFYAGKQVTVIVGSSPGGTIDGYGRLLAQNLGRHIPGNPTVIVQNMPGASGLTAALSLNATAPKDGTAIATFNSGLVVQSLVMPDRIKARFSEFSWLGSVSDDPQVCYMWAATNVKTWDDMLKKDQVVMGDAGAGSSSHILQQILRQVFGVKIKQVLGYPGGAEKRLALESGELDGECGAWLGIPPNWLADKKINLVLRFQEHLARGMPQNLTYAGELVKNDPDKKNLLDLFNASSDLGRPFILSKAVPADRLAILRAAFDQTMEDPQFLAEAEKEGLSVSPFAGVKVADIMRRLEATPPAIIARAKDIMGE